MVHRARPPSTSHSSFLRSGKRGTRRTVSVSGERKENVLQIARGQRGAGAEFGERSSATELSVSKEHNPIRYAFGIRKLVDGQHERAAVRGNLTDQPHDVVGLPQVKTVEWLVHQEQRLGREQCEREHQSAGKAF